MAAKLIFLFWVFFTLLYRVKPDLDNVGPLLTQQVIDGFNAERKNMSLDNDAVVDNNGILQLSNDHSVEVDSINIQSNSRTPLAAKLCHFPLRLLLL